MDEMITFDKGFEERFEEYMSVFGNNDVLTASQIRMQWSIYLEFELDSCRWNALWKIPRNLCDKFNIPYPTVVIVFVDSINFINLTADIEIIAVQGNFDLPLLHTASLTRLWPTKKQDELIDIISIANKLDMFRFFYFHLWMPWDLQEYDHFDWVKNNLSDRLHLFYNIRDNKIPKNKARRYRTLLNEVRNMLEILGDDGTSNKNIDILENTRDPKFDVLIDLHLKIADLKTEIEILRIYQSEIESGLVVDDTNFWMVLRSGYSLDNYSEFLQSIKNLMSGKIKYKSGVSLQDTLNAANPNDTIVIGKGKHQILSAGVLDEGAILKSQVEDVSEVIVESLHENIFIDFSGEKLILENLSVCIPLAQCGIIAQSGSLLIRNCSFSGQGLSSSQHGMVALPGADIKLESCRVSGFEIGFYISPFATLTLNNCIISDIHTPIKICTNATMSLNCCKFENYRQFGVHLESKADLEETSVADLSLVQSRINTKIVDCTFMNPESGFIVNKNSRNTINV